MSVLQGLRRRLLQGAVRGCTSGMQIGDNAAVSSSSTYNSLDRGFYVSAWRELWSPTRNSAPKTSSLLNVPHLEQRASLHSSHGLEAPAPRGRASRASEQARRSSSPVSAQSDVGVGTIYVQCTKNNTICTLVDTKGMPLAWTSAGSCGFKNARKKSTQVSQTVAETLLERVYEKGFKEVRIVMKGMGYGKQSAVRAITKSRLRILEVHEQTAVPHNGCRAPKRRRI